MLELRVVGEKGSPEAFTYGVELIKAGDSGKSYNLNAFVDEFNVWESLFAKCCVATFQITDGAGLFDNIAIQPSDKVHVVLFKGAEATADTKKIDKTFDIMNISSGGATQNRNGRIYKLSCVTNPVMLNKISTVNRAMTGKVSDMVSTISKDYLNIDPSKLTIEPTVDDKKGVLVPGFSPFKMLTWMMLHGVSEKGGEDNSLYLFYEDRDGWNFKTVGQIVAASIDKPHKYQMINGSYRVGDESDVYRIIEWQQNKPVGSNAQRLDGGMFQNELMEFNIMGRKIVSKKFDITDESNAKAFQMLGQHSAVDFVNNLKDLKQKITKVRGDLANLKIRGSEEAYGETNSYGKKYNAMLIQKQMFNQISYTFGVQGDCNMKVGDIIDVDAPSLDSKDKEHERDFDKLVNGKFIIGNLRHRMMGTTKFETIVDVFKDGMDTGQWKPEDASKTPKQSPAQEGGNNGRTVIGA